MAEKNRMEKKKLNLTTTIFIALVLGAVTGIAFYYVVPKGYIRDTVFVAGIFNVIGNGFIRAMQMLVVPLVFFSLVCGSMAMGDTKKLGRIGVKALLFYLVTTALAIVVALVVANMINPGLGLDISAVETQETTIAEAAGFSEIILNIIPTNPIQALAEGNMLQIILFAIIVGILMAYRGEKADAAANIFAQLNDLMMDMTALVMKAAPIGVFCLITKTFAGIGFDAFLPMLKYMLAVIIGLLLQCLGVYQLLLKLFAGLNPLRFLKKFFPVMAFAFSTASSNATIPVSIDTLKMKIGVPKSISSFTIPLGATINMDGTAIMQGVAVVFVAQAFGIPLTMNDYLTVILTATLASIGTAGVPGVGLVTLSMVFTSVGLPVEGIGIIMGIDRILDMSRTAVNVTGDAVCTTIIAVQDKSLQKEVYMKE